MIYLCCLLNVDRHLEAVDLELVGLSQATFCKPLTDVFSLVPLKLQDFAVFWMLNHSTIARKFLLLLRNTK